MVKEDKIKSNLGSLKELFVQTNRRFSDVGPLFGAGLAFYALLALTPLTVLLMYVISLVIGPEAARGEVSSTMTAWLGADAAKAVYQLVREVYRASNGGLAGLMGAFVLLWTSTRLFSEFRRALNRMWGIMPSEGSFITRQTDGFFKRIGAGLLTLVLAMVLSFWQVMDAYIARVAADYGIWFNMLWNFVRMATQGSMICFVITLLYRLVPDVWMSWRDAAFGAMFTTLGLVVGTEFLGLYLRYATQPSAYGVLSGLFLGMFWLGYTAQIFLYGAAFTRTFAEMSGHGVRPRRGWETVRFVRHRSLTGEE